MILLDRDAVSQRSHERAREIVDRVLGSFVAGRLLGGDDVDDIRSEVMLRVLQRFEGTGAADVRSFDDYVARMAINAANDLLRARRLAPVALELEGGDAIDVAPEPWAALAARQTLTMLWDVIRDLPLMQRRALLLHARDSDGLSAIPLLIFTGMATLDEIAAVLGYSRASMETMWQRLPMADLEIADILGMTRPRVIGLRRAARERLDRARVRIERLGHQ